MTFDPIRYGPMRARQMAAYSNRHYRINTPMLVRPRVVVLHYTVSNTYSPIFNYFNSNEPAPGPAGSRPETPGACTHFVIDKNGRIYQLIALNRMCRHIIGLNYTAIGIEFVEMSSASNILARPRQLAAGRQLVRWLQTRFGIRKANVVGHGTANNSPFFIDLKGWRNDHTDWNQQQVAIFNRRIRP